MTRVIVGADLRERLPNLSQPLEFRDEQGRLLGRYVPAAGDPGREPPPLSEEELLRREQESNFSTADVLAHLRSL